MESPDISTAVDWYFDHFYKNKQYSEIALSCGYSAEQIYLEVNRIKMSLKRRKGPKYTQCRRLLDQKTLRV